MAETSDDSVKKRWKCPECGLYFVKKARHLITHSEDKPFACDLCDFRCKWKSGLREHEHRMHSDERPFECSQCDYSTKTKATLNHHYSVKHGVEKSFKCNECDFVAEYRSKLKRHIARKHEDARPFKCSECDYCAPHLRALKEHIGRKHSVDKFFGCEVTGCNFRTGVSSELSRHVRRRHSDRKYACNECDYRSNEPTKLKRHVLGVHRKNKSRKEKQLSEKKRQVKNFTCCCCDFTSLTRTAVWEHEVIHKDEKLFVCKFTSCGYQTQSMDDHKEHRLTHKRRESCHLCNSRFYSKRDLKAHFKYHVDDGHDMQTCSECDGLRNRKRNFTLQGWMREKKDASKTDKLSDGTERQDMKSSENINDLLTATHLSMQDVFLS